MRRDEPITVLVKPSLERAVEMVKEALCQHKTIIIVGSCWVQYVGRAMSKLEPGERILMIKGDGSLLVHRSEGYEPVNWQPPGCIFHVQLDGGRLELHAIRHKPTEHVQVFFDEIYMLSSMTLKDSGEFAIYATEEDMQRAILMEPSLIEEGFRPISYEKKVEPGFVDVYGVDREGRLVVIEIKRRTAGKEAILQLAKYIEAIKGWVNREVRGILAAPAIAKDAQRILETLKIEFKALDPKRCAKVLRRVRNTGLDAYMQLGDH
ncbi:MAG: endonuclease NucS [Candidatus Bathyarchaeia archaeon]